MNIQNKTNRFTFVFYVYCLLFQFCKPNPMFRLPNILQKYY